MCSVHWLAVGGLVIGYAFRTRWNEPAAGTGHERLAGIPAIPAWTGRGRTAGRGCRKVISYNWRRRCAAPFRGLDWIVVLGRVDCWGHCAQRRFVESTAAVCLWLLGLARRTVG